MPAAAALPPGSLPGGSGADGRSTAKPVPVSGLAAGEAVLRTVHPWFTGIEGPMTKSPAVSSVAHQLGCGARVLSRLLDLGGDRPGRASPAWSGWSATRYEDETVGFAVDVRLTMAVS
ncbi:hypothetical protein Smic_79050 [Streptomyces microflavus]|uniref:Uncharacterized protein n=1 Tax=Streptomyces microflavus TaxID=1919 RepID=A0A7J0D4C4_STRMI|nr:hypothetical protein Smic_79050 [Streptomyces microflavus]